MENIDSGKYKNLVAKRGRVKSSLTRIQNYIGDESKDRGISAIQVRFEMLSGIWDKFDTIQSEIEELGDGMVFLEKEELERSEFEAMFLDVKAQIFNLLKLDKKDIKTEQVSPRQCIYVQNKLVNIPKFNGNSEKWVQFFELFKGLVHDNKDLEPIEKMQYLISSLEGNALEVLAGIEIKGENYTTAWQELNNRFHNDKLLIEKHMSALFDFPKIDKPSANSIRGLNTHFNKHLKALKLMGEPVEGWSSILVHLLTSKFDGLTLQAWEKTSSGKKYPEFQKLKEFLEDRAIWLESFEAKGGGSIIKKLNKTDKNCFFTKGGSDCKICKTGSHPVFYCEQFKNKSVSERRALIKNLNYCWNCLSSKHLVKDCKSSNCKHCEGKHNSLLCDSKKQTTAPTSNKYHSLSSTNADKEGTLNKVSYSIEKPFNSNISLVSKLEKSQILLATATINIFDDNNKPHKFRVILDSGSELNFITTDFANQLFSSSKNVNFKVSGIGGSNSSISKKIRATISSNNSNFLTTVNFYLLDNLSGNKIPQTDFNISSWKIPRYIMNNLADPEFCTTQEPISGLLGAAVFFQILKGQKWKADKIGPYFINTLLGWVVSGTVSSNLFNQQLNSVCFLTLSAKGKKKYDDELCENIFNTYVKHNIEGRFVVQLPFNVDSINLGNSLEGAQKRFYGIEKRLAYQPQVKREYIEFMEEYLTMGHMEIIPNNEINTFPNYYLPHHAVFKDSTTTKTRIVFDASFKSSNGLSLNDCLLVGPNIQNDLFSILINFRYHKYVITGDVCKMYRQIRVDKIHCDFQRIVWRSNSEQALQHYRLLTVTYGTNCAPFLAVRCLHQLADEITSTQPEIANIIKTRFYMDDVMTGTHSVGDLIIIREQLESVLHSRGFELRKWCSNSAQLMSQLHEKDKGEHFIINTSSEGDVKALGITWKPETDLFCFKIHSCNFKQNITKRIILADINKFWDPLGLLSAVLIKGKIFLQELWQVGLHWDEPLPRDFQIRWIKFRETLGKLDGLMVPRRASYCTQKIELHGFCDASIKAYGCCIYILSVGDKGNFISELLCAKGRVIPLKGGTIPRLELNAALLLADTMNKVQKALDCNCSCYYWSDSQVVLNWILASPVQFKSYVANRIVQIHELTKDNQWNYVSSKDNPADLVSRGVSPQYLKNAKNWWKGPPWLTLGRSYWPKIPVEELSEDTLEKRKIKFSLLSTREEPDILRKYSSWIKLIRVMAYVLRFIENTRVSQKSKLYGFLKVEEISRSKKCIIRMVQQQCFDREITQLQKAGRVKNKSKLLSLAPFLDEDDLIRVGGRLTNADLSNDQIHPLILPYKHNITELILTHLHVEGQHAGPQLLLAITRLEFWPLNGKSAARAVVHNCITCKRANPRVIYPVMASLPQSRVNPGRPFQTCGVDFCGPILIKTGLRKVIKNKAYISVFVCFTTKAIHLELVSSLSSDAFLAALKRFFARRGKSSDIHSDNGTNFVGAYRELNILFENLKYINHSVPEYLANQGIRWHFIPPGAPHFGGIWESAVKSIKQHLLKVMGSSLFNFEEVYTILTQVEACLNSRPLVPISNHPADSNFLTPAHFLIGGPILLPPESDVADVPPNRLKRWQLVQQASQKFWRRWSIEYLTNLQTRTKWRLPTAKAIPVGTLVLIKDENLPSLQWKAARVVSLHPGKDGVTRVATVRTANGAELKRPLVKLCPLLDCEEVNRR